MTEGRKELEPGEVTRLLQRLPEGGREEFDLLMPLIYDELRAVAERQLRRERPDHTLHPTALVHEAYLKLADDRHGELQGRSHFLAIAARAMRQILIDHARARAAAKRGGDRKRTSLTHQNLAAPERGDELLALVEALDRLDRIDERQRKVVEYRYFGGMTEDEIAEVLGMSARSVRRDWVKARAWLYRELYEDS